MEINFFDNVKTLESLERPGGIPRENNLTGTLKKFKFKQKVKWVILISLKKVRGNGHRNN